MAYKNSLVIMIELKYTAWHESFWDFIYITYYMSWCTINMFLCCVQL